MTQQEIPGDALPLMVLDTNVCLDLFVFDDARCLRLRAALHAGEVIAVTTDACREEWLRVLRYPQLALDEVARETATARFDAVMQRCPPQPARPEGTANAPRCRDQDDQKFLDLALHAGASWLLSRDDHLLALARRARREGLFEILTPQEWVARHAA
jgi:putative PIN family toxin of toxin-antitoxin system